MVENDFEANEQRRPRAPRQESDDEAVNSNVGDPVDDNMDDPPDLEEDKDETNDDDKEIVIPPDPAHEAKMAALRAENAQLLQNKIESWKRCGTVYQKSRRPHDNAGRSFIMKNNGIGLVGRHKNLFQVLYSFHLYYIQVCK